MPLIGNHCYISYPAGINLSFIKLIDVIHFHAGRHIFRVRLKVKNRFYCHPSLIRDRFRPGSLAATLTRWLFISKYQLEVWHQLSFCFGDCCCVVQTLDLQYNILRQLMRWGICPHWHKKKCKMNISFLFFSFYALSLFYGRNGAFTACHYL